MRFWHSQGWMAVLAGLLGECYTCQKEPVSMRLQAFGQKPPAEKATTSCETETHVLWLVKAAE